MMTPTEKALRDELQAAHQIIRHALNLMTPEQKQQWGDKNEAAGVAGEGITRANERESVLNSTLTRRSWRFQNRPEACTRHRPQRWTKDS